MKLNTKNKKVIIFCIFILVIIIAIVIGIYFYKRNNNTENDTIIEDAYIDVWKYTFMDTDITLYSTGSGVNEKLYLGRQPVHYLVNKSGAVHMYQASSYQNKMTGKRDPATVEYIKTLSQSELENLENELKSIIETNNTDSISSSSTYWYIKIDGNSTRVNVDVQTNILNDYL